MSRHSDGWQRVSKKEPCQVCEADSWCLLSDDGSTAICMRAKSDKPKTFKDGTVGYIHKLKDDGGSAMRIVARKKKPRVHDTELHVRFAPLCRSWYVGKSDRIEKLAAILSVPTWALDTLHVGWDGGAWTFPEQNHRGQIVGVNRRLLDGSKFCVIGSRRGLTYADDWSDGIGPVFLVEGGSDTATGIAMGLSIIGRPSNLGGIEYLSRMLAKVQRRIIIIGENDEKDRSTLPATHDPECQCCGQCFPGQFGAIETSKRLSRKLNRIVPWVLPPDGAKDLRAWLAKWRPDPNNDKAMRKFGQVFIRRVSNV